jgi:hypothetical protein
MEHTSNISRQTLLVSMLFSSCFIFISVSVSKTHTFLITQTIHNKPVVIYHVAYNSLDSYLFFILFVQLSEVNET